MGYSNVMEYAGPLHTPQLGIYRTRSNSSRTATNPKENTLMHSSGGPIKRHGYLTFSWTRYSFTRADNTVNGLPVSAIIAIATVVQAQLWLLVILTIQNKFASILVLIHIQVLDLLSYQPSQCSFLGPTTKKKLFYKGKISLWKKKNNMINELATDI